MGDDDSGGVPLDLGIEHGGLSDAALAIGIARRSLASLAEVYARHGGSVYGLASRVCGQAHAHEVTEAVFLELWRDPERFDPACTPLRSHLVAQAHRRAAELCRTARTGAANDEPDVFVDDDTFIAGWPLAESERGAIMLAYLGAHTYHEIAGILDVPQATVARWIRSGLDRLRELIGRNAPGPA
jgi:RNA polymerase sigma-70 factor (ECF subfamily)